MKLQTRLEDACGEIRTFVDHIEAEMPTRDTTQLIEALKEKVHILQALNALTNIDRIVNGLEKDYSDVAP